MIPAQAEAIALGDIDPPSDTLRSNRTLGALARELIGNGSDIAGEPSGGVARGALRTLAAVLDVIQAAQWHAGDDAPSNAIDTALVGLARFAEFSAELDERMVRANADAFSDARRKALAAE